LSAVLLLPGFCAIQRHPETYGLNPRCLLRWTYGYPPVGYIMVIVRDYKWFMRNSIADECPFDYVFPFSWNAVPIRENLLSNQILKQSLKRISK
jgi:hypothetical protein